MGTREPSSPALRDAIKAEAYFAFNSDAASDFAGAIEDYLAESLYRPTHSPEEAFYNMLRIEKTHQMIYKEDRLFENVIGEDGQTSDATFNILGAWGWDGSELVNYRGSGWLSGKVDAGQVWWMLYAMRWLTAVPTTAAVTQLQDCYDNYWSKGNPGGLASTYCNAANAGIPKGPSSLQADIDYAGYLLDGQSPGPAFKNDNVPPRWTMDDSS
jgi:hypothetical protein